MARWWLSRLLLCALIALGLASPSHGAPKEPRLALVIANAAYDKFDRLAGTYGDGDKVAQALSSVGFVDSSGAGTVVAHRDLGIAAMQAEISRFRDRLAAAGPTAFGVVYFSGHGAALGSFGDVIMLPVDAGHDLSADAAALSRAAVTRTLLGSGARTVLIVLDMCRNVLATPPSFTPATDAPESAAGPVDASAAKGLRRITRGSNLALRADQGFLIAFSTSPDQVAFDDGVFSKVFAEEIRRPQQNIADALKRVSDRVALRPGKSLQKPTFDYGLQGAPPCFISCDPSVGTDRFYDCANCPYMRIVPAGEGVVGSPAGEPGRGGGEPLQHAFTLPRPIAVGVYEVTLAEWKACVRDSACRPIVDWSKDNPNPLIPATDISFEDAQAFLAWLSVQSGRPYRLLTEAEWEFADRAGSLNAFPWGDEITPGQANYDQTAAYHGSPTAPFRGYPEAVNAYPPNGFGLYQMQGNVWEWTSGCLDPACARHVLRGGSFQSAPGELRSGARFGAPAGKRRDDVGLRVARDLQPDEAGG